MSDPTLLVSHYVPDDGVETIRAALADRYPDRDRDVRVATTPAETRELVPDAEGLVTFRLPDDHLDVADELRWVQALSAGVDSYDRDALAERGIALTNASGVHAEPIGEQVLAYLLCFARNLHKGIEQSDDGVWERYSGTELRDATVGVVGLGAIGGRVAELCSALGCTVVGTKRDTATAPDAADEVYGPDDLYEVLPRADYLVVACPLTDATEGLIGSDELRAMPDDGVLVNIARGEVVDEAALTRALQNRTIRGAGLDVFEEEPLPPDSVLWDLSNVVLTPHMAGSTPHYMDRCADIVADNYGAFVEGDFEGLRNRIV